MANIKQKSWNLTSDVHEIVLKNVDVLFLQRTKDIPVVKVSSL